jgi:hypothetical protein
MLSIGAWVGGMLDMTLHVSSRRVVMLGVLNASGRRGRTLGRMLSVSAWLGGMLDRMIHLSGRRVGIVGMLDMSSGRGGTFGGMLSSSICVRGFYKKVFCVSSWRVEVVGVLDASSRQGGIFGILGWKLIISVWLDGMLDATLFSCVLGRNRSHPGLHKTFNTFSLLVCSFHPFIESFVVSFPLFSVSFIV